MKRRKLNDGEHDQMQRLRAENRKLKQQISQLRKQISRIDLDRFQNLKDLLDSQEADSRQEEIKEAVEQDKREWACHDCKTGTLFLTVFERRDGVFYFRQCGSCPKRTRTKRYTSDVRGIRKSEG